MHQRVAAINDLSGLGRCSLGADLAVLPAMGIEACALPTAVLTAQTGYPGYKIQDNTAHMPDYTAHWQKLGVHFSGILSGYLTGPAPARCVEDFLDAFHRPGVLYLCDPVLGDGGKIYRGFTAETIAAVKKLAARADILTPNLTEFCLLTDTSLAEIRETSLSHPNGLCQFLTEKARLFQDKKLVITGIHLKQDGQEKIGNFLLENGNGTLLLADDLGGSYSGTGDLFAAVLLGGLLQDRTFKDTVRLAGTFIASAIQNTQKEHTPGNDGINFEPYLGMLGKK